MAMKNIIVLALTMASAHSFALGALAKNLPHSNIKNPNLHFIDILGGSDERKEIKSSSDPRHDRVGEVNVTFKDHPDADAACTGVLIGKDMIITSAHCVLSFQVAEVPSEITFDAGLRNYSFIHPREVAAEIFVPQFAKRALFNSELTLEYYNYDFALVRFKPNPSRPPIGEKVGFYEIKPLPLSTLFPKSMITLGYPGDKPLQTLWETECSILGVLQIGIMVSDCDSIIGQSGGPVLVDDQLVGINSATLSDATYGTLITTQMAKEITAILEHREIDAPSFVRLEIK